MRTLCEQPVFPGASSVCNVRVPQTNPSTREAHLGSTSDVSPQPLFAGTGRRTSQQVEQVAPHGQLVVLVGRPGGVAGVNGGGLAPLVGGLGFFLKLRGVQLGGLRGQRRRRAREGLLAHQPVLQPREGKGAVCT
eukprot:335342-Pyramimonas_sp.AAC.1